ncbi:MAG: hypothetical protein ABIK89_03985, partial [Planctomycetota bacterium]
TARITAITCETSAESEHLHPLPQSAVSPAETAWINSHTISAKTLPPLIEKLRAADRQRRPTRP